MSREELYGRLIAIATVIGDRVFEKGTLSIADEFLDKIGKEPAKTVERIHQKLMNYAHKFGAEEMTLLDMFGELIAQLDIDDFNNVPIGNEYLAHYYRQKASMFVGVAEAAEILGWDKRKVATYISRGVFPQPTQRLASGPIWTRRQIEEYRDSRA